MQETYKIIKLFLSEYSMEIVLFIGGALGVAYADNNSDAVLTKKERIIRMFFGGATAVFSTGLFSQLLETYTKIEVTPSVSAGIGFYIGYLGLTYITKFMMSFKSKKENTDV